MHFPTLTLTLLLTLSSALPIDPRNVAATNAEVVTEPGKGTIKVNRRGDDYRRSEAATNAIDVPVPGSAPYQQERRGVAATNAVTVGPCIKITKARDLEGRFIPVGCQSYAKRGVAATNAVTLPWDECISYFNKRDLSERALPICNF